MAMFKKLKSLLLENRTAKQTVAKNTFWLTVSTFGGKFIKAAVIIYAARVLGTAGYGVFSYAVTLTGFITLFMDPGLDGIVTRDASKADEYNRRIIFDTTFIIKIFLISIGALIIAFVAPLFTTLPGAKELLPIVALIMAIDTLQGFFCSLILAQEKMEWYAVVFLVMNAGIAVFGFIFISHVASAKSFGWGYVVGDALGVLIAGIIIRRYFKKIFSKFSIHKVMPILKAAWPFAIGGALGLLFTNTDILMISWIRSASEVGIYSAVIRVTQTLYLIPGVLQASTLPLFSRLARKDDLKFRAALEKTLSMIFFASIPLSIGGIILGTPLMALLFGEQYAVGGLALEILLATLIFDFSATIIINALFAYEHQKSMAVSAAIGGSLNVILDLALIPAYGIVGSAIATFIAQAINNWYLWHAMRNLNNFTILPYIKKIIASSIVMGIVTISLSIMHVEVLINISASAIIYLVMLRMLREPLLIEIKRLFSARYTSEQLS